MEVDRKYCLPPFVSALLYTSAFTMGLSSMSMTTSPWAAAIIATAKSMETGYNKPLLYVADCVCICLSPCMCVYTSSRHAGFTVNPIRITAELLQAVNGALTHHRFPTEWPVVNYLKHNWRGVHLLFGKKLR